MAFEYLIKKMFKTLGQIVIIELGWRKSNEVLYNIAKLKVIEF